MMYLLPVLAVLGFSMGRWVLERCRLESKIALEGATYLKAYDGRMWIRQHAPVDRMLLAMLGSLGIGFLSVMIHSIGVAIDGVAYGLGGCGFVLFLAYLIRSLQRPDIAIDPHARVIDIGRGRARYQMSFAAIAYLSLTSLTHYYDNEEWTSKVKVFEIRLGLHTKDALVIGAITERRMAHQDAVSMARMIAETTGASLLCLHDPVDTA